MNSFAFIYLVPRVSISIVWCCFVFWDFFFPFFNTWSITLIFPKFEVSANRCWWEILCNLCLYILAKYGGTKTELFTNFAKHNVWKVVSGLLIIVYSKKVTDDFFSFFCHLAGVMTCVRLCVCKNFSMLSWMVKFDSLLTILCLD